MPTHDSHSQELAPGRLQARLNFTRKAGEELLRLAIDEKDGLFLCREFSIASLADKLTQHQHGRWRTLDDARQWLASRHDDYLQAGWNLIFMYQTKNAEIDLLEGPWFRAPQSICESVQPLPHLGPAAGDITTHEDSESGLFIITGQQPHQDRIDRTFETVRFIVGRENAVRLAEEIVDCWEDLEPRELHAATEISAFTDTPALKAFAPPQPLADL